MLLPEFKEKLLDLALGELWTQWNAIGVAGNAENQSNSVVDPEALLLATLRFGRYDQRLFDEMLDWMSIHHKMISIQRISKLQENLNLCDIKVLSAVASWVGSSDSTSKWKRIAALQDSAPTSRESLFFLKNGMPQPQQGPADSLFLEYGFIRNAVNLRKMSSAFKAGNASNILLQLRSLFGVNTRAEIILLLFVNESLAIQDIADKSFYSWHAIQSTLQDLNGSGMFIHGGAKRNRKYSLIHENWSHLFGLPVESIAWNDWARLYGILCGLWQFCSDPNISIGSPMLHATLLRKWVIDSRADLFEKAGLSALVHRVEHAEVEVVMELLWKELRHSFS